MSNANGAILRALLRQVILIALNDVDVQLNRANGLRLVELARLLDRLVRVVVLEHEFPALIVDDVVECRRHQATVAAEARINTVHKVRLREALKPA